MTADAIIEAAKTRPLTAVEARAILKVREPREVAFVNSKGESLNDDGDKIDPRELEPWTMALGPFGSWPCTVADAERTIAKHAEFEYGVSCRIGPCIIWEQGWGFSALSASRETE